MKKTFIQLYCLLIGIVIVASYTNAKGQTWSNFGAPGFSSSAAYSTSLAFDGSGTPYVAYEDFGNSQKATVMKYNGSSWAPLGVAGFSAGATQYTSLAIDGSGTPYVAFLDGATSYFATVMKYNGSSWVLVGSAGFSGSMVQYTSIAIDGSGTPYVAYEDNNAGNKATVMKFNGTSWVTVGTAGFTAGVAQYISLKIDGTGAPYIAYNDVGTSGKASVMKYNGSSWVNVGTPGFSTNTAYYTSLAIDATNTPYVVYEDMALSGYATVMKYDGSSWVNVGTPGFSAGLAWYCSIAIDGSATPYVSYEDGGSSSKATVMKYNGTAWTNVGSAGFSAGAVNYTSIAINSSGIPYVAYEDIAASNKATVMDFCTGLPVVAPVTGPITVCPGNVITLSDATSGGVWSSENPAVATVTGGVVTGVSAGNVLISYTVTNTCGSTSAAALVRVGNTIITTIAGTSAAGFSGDGGQATAAEIQGPNEVCLDVSGNIYFSDATNNRIRKISTTGVISEIAGNGIAGYSGDGLAATSAELNDPTGLVVDGAGNVYIGDLANHVVRKVNTSGIITTIAGIGGVPGYSGDGFAATAAHLHNPYGLVFDSFGNLYIADQVNNVIRKINTSGIISTVVGTGASGFFGDGGAAATAELAQPNGIAIDAANNLYITDNGNHRIREVNASGIINTLTGTGTPAYGGEGVVALGTSINWAAGLKVDSAGDLIFSEAGDNRIRMINTSGILSTIVGNGAASYSGDGSAATAAAINSPLDVAIDNQNNILIADYVNSRIRKVAPVSTAISAASTTLCQGVPVLFTNQTLGGTWTSSNSSIASVGSTTGVVTGVAAGTATITYTLAFSCGSPYVILPITVNAFSAGTISGPEIVCPGSTITLTNPTGSGGTWRSSNIAAGTISSGGIVTGIAAGNTIISYTITNSCGTLAAMQLVTVGNPTITTIAGTGVAGVAVSGIAATSAALNQSIHLSTDASGNLYFSDYYNSVIRKISPSGIITTVAGNGISAYSGDGLAATNASIFYPSGTAVDGAGNLYFCDYGSYEIRKVNTAGIISTVAGTGFVGSGADGIPATASAVNHCWGVATDGAGNVYFSDRYNSKIRKINTSGIISTIAGTGTAGFSGDGGPASAAQINQPLDLNFDRSGNLIFADGSNNRIRKITPLGIISTIAGNGTVGFGGDGALATASGAEFNNPVGIAIDSAGDIYIGDYFNNRVRKIDNAGILSTVSGLAGAGGYNGDNIPATAAELNTLQGVAIMGTGDIYVCDANNYRIRKISPVAATVADITGANVVCVGATTPLADVTVSGTWSSNLPGIASVSSTGIVSGVSAGVAVITYSVVYSCGTLTKMHTVTVNPLPDVPVVITGPTTICLGSSSLLGNTIPGGVWSSTIPAVATIGSSSGSITGISLGATTISYTVSNSCGSNSIFRFDTVVSAPGPITGTLSACAGFTSLLGNTATGGTWSSSVPGVATIGSGSGLVFALAPGTTTITYNTGGACIATAVFTVNTYPAAITPSGGVSMCVGSTAILGDVTAGGTWSSAATGTATVASGTVTGVASGTVNISYTSAAGCSVVEPVTVLVTPAAISPSSVAVCVGSTVALSESVGGGTWSSMAAGTAGVVSGTVTGVATGTTSVSYTIGTCAVGVPVTVNANPAAITPAGAVSMCEGATVSLGDATPGGTWSSSATGTATISSTGIATGVAAGTVTISYTSGVGCSAVKPVTVLTTPAALSPASAIVCTGTTQFFTDALGGGTWSSTAPAIASVAGGTVTGNAVGTANISYTIGTCAVGAPVTVNLSADAGVISGLAILCTGTAATYTESAAGGVWSSSNTAIATVSTSGLVSALTAGTFTLSYAVTNGCGTATATKVIIVRTSPDAGTIIGTTLVCAGTFTTLVDTTSGGVWSASNGNATITGTGILSGVVPGAIDTISYSVTNTCGTTSTTKIITVGLFLTAGSITGASSVCVGTAITLADLTVGGVWSSSNASASVSGGTVTGLLSGVDTISYTVTSGCGSAIATHVVSVNPVAVSGSIVGPSILCAGFTATYTDPATGGVWSVTNANATISGVGFLNAIAAGNDTIHYTVTNSCGIATATAYVTMGPAISAGSISGPGSVCVGSLITLTDVAPGGVWSSSNTSATVLGGVVTGLSAGIDTVAYSVSSSCGSVSAIAVVTVNPAAVAAAISGPSSLCMGSVVTYTDASPGGVWSSSNGSVSISSGGVATPVTPGTDTISYSIATSCGTSTAMAVVNVIIVPVAGTISGPANICVGTSVTLTDATTGGAWSASNGNATVTGGVVAGIAAGLDTIAYTVSSSCGTAIATYVVALDNSPSPGTITGPSTVCEGSLITLADTAIGGAWSASNPDATISIAGVVTGIVPGIDTMSYTVTNVCGSFSTTHIVTVSTTAPTAGIITGPATVCAGAAITLTDTAPGGTWGSSNATATVAGGVVTGIIPGADTITYMVSSGCGTATASAIITVGASLVAGTISGAADVCVGAAVTLTDPMPGGMWSSSNAHATVAGGVVAGVTAGTDTISYTLSGSCGSASATKVVTISAPPSAGSITGATGVCAGASTTLADVATGGTWSASNTRASISSVGVVTGLTTGLDTMIYTVSNGCGSAATTHILSVNGAPAAGSLSGASSVCPGASVTLAHSVSGGAWSSSNTGIAMVSGSGVVAGVTSGAAVITYTVANSCGTSHATHAITVLSAASCSGLQVNGLGVGNEELKVAPNPNNGSFTMNLVSDIDEEVHIVITNVLGEKVKELTTTTNKVTELQINTAAGIYLLTASTANGMHVAKVIIN